MARNFRYDFLKLEFAPIYEDIKALEEKKVFKEINEGIEILIDDIIYFIYKKNRVLYDENLNYLKRLEVLKEINILPNNIFNKITLLVEEMKDESKFQGTEEEKEKFFDSKRADLYEIIAWFVTNCGEENYYLIAKNLNEDELRIFIKYLPEYKATTALKKKIDSKSIEEDDEEKEKQVAKLVEAGENYYLGRGVSKSSKKAYECFLNAAKFKNEYAESYLGLFYEKGIAVNRNYEIAFQWYYKAAIKGNAFAQYALGMLYFEGNGVIKDYYKAFLWFQKSAENDYVEAFYQLGRCYYSGFGCEESKDKAFKWYQKAAEENFSAAQYALSLMYKNGEGCDTNMISAYYWIEKSAENGYEDAYYIIGKSYLEGIYVDVDYKKAFYYLNKGYEALDTSCIEALGDMYLKGCMGKKDVYKALEFYNIAIDYGEKGLFFKVGKIYEEEGLINQAVKYYEEGHNEGNLKCTQRLGIMYYNGEGVERNLDKAIEYMQIAVQKKEPHAMYVLAVAYLRTNKFGEKTTEISKELLKRAFELKSPYAAESLASLMINELKEGKEINNDELIKYIRFGVENGLENSIFQYGYIYEKGIGVPQDLETAYYYYNIAAEKNSINAIVKIADWYKKGIYFKCNIDLAIRWYEKAADMGDLDATESLIEIYEKGFGNRQSDLKAIFYVFKLCDLDVLKGKEKLAYYCFKGIGIEENEEKGNELINEIEDIDKGSADYLRGKLAQENFIKMSQDEIIKLYEDGIEYGNLRCYGELAVYLYNNNLYDNEKYADKFALAMQGKDLGSYKCSYIFLKQKLKEVQTSSIVTIEELMIVKKIKLLINKGVYEGIEDLITWYKTRKVEDKIGYHELMQKAYYYKIYN